MKKPNSKLVQELKKQHGELYNAEVDRQLYIFRALTFAEFKEFNELELGSADIEDEIVIRAVVYPVDVDLNTMKPGTVTSLCNEILEYSGFISIEQAMYSLFESREKVHHAVEVMKAFIIAAIPATRFEDLDDLTMNELTHRVAIAEKIFEIQVGIQQQQEIQMSFTLPEEAEAAPKKVHDFTLEDIEKANKNPDAGTKLGNASAADPIAQKLHQALR